MGQLKAGLADGIRRRTRLLRSLITREPWDFFYGVFCEAHCAGHLMWSPEQTAQSAGNLLREVYADLDRALGEIIAACPPETACVVFFSHGMGPNHHGDHLFPELLRRFHLRLENGGESLPVVDGRKVRGGVATIWQHSIGKIPETWRHRVESWLPSDVRSWLILKRDQSPRVWARMPSFALPMSDGHSELRVNLVGREAQGRVQSGDAYHAYLEALVAELFSLTHSDTGEPAVDVVFRPDGNFDPMTLRAAPDLLIWWRKSQPFRSLRSPSLGIIAGEPIDVRPGEHIMHGMLLLSHRQARHGYCATEGLSALDIAPTICVMAGVQPPRTLPGADRSKEWFITSQ